MRRRTPVRNTTGDDRIQERCGQSPSGLVHTTPTRKSAAVQQRGRTKPHPDETRTVRTISRTTRHRKPMHLATYQG